MCVLYGGLGISKLQFEFSIKKSFTTVICFQFLVIKALDSDSYPYTDPKIGKMLDPDNTVKWSNGVKSSQSGNAVTFAWLPVHKKIELEAFFKILSLRKYL